MNNHVGLPLTLLSTPPDCNALVLEMGMSAPGEIAHLTEISRPHITVLTGVAEAHLAGCGATVSGIASCKAEALRGASVVVVGTGEGSQDSIMGRSMRANPKHCGRLVCVLGTTTRMASDGTC